MAWPYFLFALDRSDATGASDGGPCQPKWWWCKRCGGYSLPPGLAAGPALGLGSVTGFMS